MNPLIRFFYRFLGLTALESAILTHFTSMLPASEAAVFKRQIQKARFRRAYGGGSVAFLQSADQHHRSMDAWKIRLWWS